MQFSVKQDVRALRCMHKSPFDQHINQQVSAHSSRAVLRFAAEKIGAFPMKIISGISPGFILLFGGAGFLW